MNPEIPPDVAIETVYIIEAVYGPDAAEARRPVRPEHLARIADLRDRGIVIEAGGYADFSTSLVMVRAASEEEALAIARNDVYSRSAVWIELRARAFGRVIRPGERSTR